MVKTIAAGALLAAVPPTAQAQTRDVGSALASSGSVGVESDVNGAATLAQGLNLAAGDYTIRQLTWWGTPFLGVDNPTTFHIRLFNESTTQPGEPSDVARSATDLTSANFTALNSGFVDSDGISVMKFGWTPATSISLHSDGLVFVSIQGEYAGASDTFLWSALGRGGVFFQRDTAGTSGWTEATGTAGGPLALVLSLTQVAAVPEPASWAVMLLGFGIAGIALRTRRKTTQLI